MNEQTDKLKDLFHEIKLEDTSQNFMKDLMLRVEKESVAQKRKKQLNLYLYLFAGIIGIIGIPALIIFALGLDLQASEMQMPNLFLTVSTVFHGLIIDSFPIVLCLTVLFLLIGDLLFRKFMNHHKKEKDLIHS